MADGKPRKSPGPMRSKSQWRYLYAVKAPFAHRWSEQVVAERGKKTGYHSLPEHRSGTAQARANRIRTALTHGK